MKKQLSLLTVAGGDRPGIIAGVTEILYKRGCNLEDVSMTVLDKELAMMMVVSVPPEKKKHLAADLEILKKKKSLNCFWSDLRGSRRRGEAHVPGTRSCIVTAIGRDKTGIVYKISGLLSKRKLNITDLNSRIIGKDPRALYAMILEVDVPAKVSLKSLESDLKKLEKSLGVEISLRKTERLEL